MHFFQKEEKKSDTDDNAKAPIVTISGYQQIECTLDKNGMYNDYAAAVGYEGSEIYVAVANVGNYVTINPNIQGWNPTDMSDIVTSNSWSEAFDVAPSMDANDNWVFSFRLDDKSPVVLGFKDGGKVVKVVVIDRNWDAASRKHTFFKKK